MKNYKNIFAASVFFCVLTGVVVTASAQDSKPGFATVVRIEGNCTYSLDNGAVWHPLVPGKYLVAGSQIRTSDNGVVDVILGKAIDLPQAKWAPERISLARDQKVRGMISYMPTAEQNVVRLMPNALANHHSQIAARRIDDRRQPLCRRIHKEEQLREDLFLARHGRQRLHVVHAQQLAVQDAHLEG